MTAPRRPDRSGWRRLVTGIAVVAVFAFGLPQFADYGDVWSHVRTMAAGDAIALAWLAIWNLFSYQLLLMAALPGLGLRQAALASQASTSISNVAPGGAALGVAVTWSMYRSFGFSREQIVQALAVAGFWNSAVKLALPAVALAFLTAGDDAPPILLGGTAIAVLGAAVWAGAAFLRSETLALRAASRVDQMLRRWPVVTATVADRADRLRRQTLDLVSERWLSLSITALVSHASLFVVLLMALRAVGIGRGVVSLGEAVTAFAVVRVALIVPLTPGGAGLSELGLTGMLVAAGGEADAVVAAVLLFRALTWLVPIPLGGLAYLWWSLTRHPATAEVVGSS